MANHVSVNKNAVKLLGTQRMRAINESFSKYKKTVGGDKRGELMQMFRAPKTMPKDMLARGLCEILVDIGASDAEKKAAAMLNAMIVLAKQGAQLDDLELKCKLFLAGEVPNLQDEVRRALSGRTDIIVNQIAGFLEGKSILDLGTGDGKVGAALARRGFSVSLADVLDFRAPEAKNIRFEKYDGKTLPFGNKSVDNVLLLTVLHHADEAIRVFEEAVRVARNRIIVIESVYFNNEHRKLNMFLDWFYNRVIHNNVNCPFNFQSPSGWESTFSKFGFNVLGSRDLGVDQRVVPEYHWLYALEVPK